MFSIRSMACGGSYLCLASSASAKAVFDQFARESSHNEAATKIFMEVEKSGWWGVIVLGLAPAKIMEALKLPFYAEIIAGTWQGCRRESKQKRSIKTTGSARVVMGLLAGDAQFYLLILQLSDFTVVPVYMALQDFSGRSEVFTTTKLSDFDIADGLIGGAELAKQTFRNALTEAGYRLLEEGSLSILLNAARRRSDNSQMAPWTDADSIEEVASGGS